MVAVDNPVWPVRTAWVEGPPIGRLVPNRWPTPSVRVRLSVPW